MSAYDKLRVGWRLDAADATIHSVKGSCDLTRSGDPAVIPGHFGWGLRFDGTLDRYSTAAAGANNSVAGEFTLTFWFRLTSLPSAEAHDFYFFDTNSGADDGLDVYIKSADDLLTIKARKNDDSGWVFKSWGPALAINTWYFVRVWWETADGDIHMTLNEMGIWEAQKDTVGEIHSVAGKLSVAGTSTASNLIHSDMQDIYLFDGLLNADEVEEVYDSGNGRSSPFNSALLSTAISGSLKQGARFNFPLDDVPADGVYQETIQGYHLTPYGAPTSRTPLVDGFDRALSLSGVSQSVFCAATPRLLRRPWGETGVCSIRAWVKGDVLGAVLRIIAGCDDGTTGWSMYLRNTDERFGARVRAASGVEARGIAPAPIINHVYQVMMYIDNDASKLGLVLDGGKYSGEWDILDGSFTQAAAAIAGIFAIGARGDIPTGGEWDGGIQYVTIWNRKLTTQEMEDDYFGGRGFVEEYDSYRPSCLPARVIGAFSELFIADESVWGVWAGDVPYGLEYSRETLKSQYAAVDHQHRIEEGRAAVAGYQTDRDPGGEIRGELQPHGPWPLLFKHALGAAATSGSYPYVHTIEGSDVLPLGFSLEKIFGLRGGGTSPRRRYLGCKVDQLFLACQSDGIVTARTKVLAREETIDTVTIHDSNWPTDNYPYLATQATVRLALASDSSPSLTTICTRVELNINNHLQTGRSPEDGERRATLLPGPRTIGGSISAFFTTGDAVTWLAAWHANTSMQLRITFNRAPWSFDIYLPAIKLRGSTPQIADRGPLNLRIPFTAFKDSSLGTDILVTITNADPNIGTAS